MKVKKIDLFILIVEATLHLYCSIRFLAIPVWWINTISLVSCY